METPMPHFSTQHPRPSGSGWAVVALLIGRFPLPMPAHAHMRGMYATNADAEKPAAALKCKGNFAMGSKWMPCLYERASHQDLQ